MIYLDFKRKEGIKGMESSIYSSVTDAVAAAKGAYCRYMELTLNERQEILEHIKHTKINCSGCA